MNKPCDNCPFNSRGLGLALRKSLRPGRWRGILYGVLLGQPFYCHKTTTGEDDDNGEYLYNGKEQVCAGSLLYRDKQTGGNDGQRNRGRH